MDIESYPEFIEKIDYIKNKDSVDAGNYIVKSVNEYLELIFKHQNLGIEEDCSFESEENFKKNEEQLKNIYYRGQANSNWSIECSLFRNDLVKSEEKLIHEIINRKPKEFLECKTSLEKLILMQHYGIPTRLLDITSNPLVALYFSCESQNENDGVVYIFEEDYEIDLNFQEIISCFAFFKDGGLYEDFEKILKKENVIFDKSLNEVILKKNYILIKPMMNNDRIIAQQGLFLCCSNNRFEGDIDHNPKIRKFKFDISASKKIIIDKEFKINILKELSLLGIKKSTLFPEIENHSEELINKFKTTKITDEIIEIKKDIVEVSFSPEKNILQEIEELEFSSKEKILKEITPYINDDFYHSEQKKSLVRTIIRRSGDLNQEDKEKLLEIIV